MHIPAGAHRMRPIEKLVEEKNSYTVEEVFPEMAWSSGGASICGGRGKEGLTQKQLAELTGIAQHHINEMENSKRPTRKEIAKKLAAALNVDYRTFL